VLRELRWQGTWDKGRGTWERTRWVRSVKKECMGDGEMAIAKRWRGFSMGAVASFRFCQFLRVAGGTKGVARIAMKDEVRGIRAAISGKRGAITNEHLPNSPFGPLVCYVFYGRLFGCWNITLAIVHSLAGSFSVVWTLVCRLQRNAHT